MKYFKYGHGKWYPANLIGSTHYLLHELKAGFNTFNKIFSENLSHLK